MKLSIERDHDKQFQVEIKMQNFSHKGKPPEANNWLLALHFVVTLNPETDNKFPYHNLNEQHQQNTSIKNKQVNTWQSSSLILDIADNAYELVASFTGKNPLNP